MYNRALAPLTETQSEKKMIQAFSRRQSLMKIVAEAVELLCLDAFKRARACFIRWCAKK